MLVYRNVDLEDSSSNGKVLACKNPPIWACSGEREAWGVLWCQCTPMYQVCGVLGEECADAWISRSFLSERG